MDILRRWLLPVAATVAIAVVVVLGAAEGAAGSTGGLGGRSTVIGAVLVAATVAFKYGGAALGKWSRAPHWHAVAAVEALAAALRIEAGPLEPDSLGTLAKQLQQLGDRGLSSSESLSLGLAAVYRDARSRAHGEPIAVKLPRRSLRQRRAVTLLAVRLPSHTAGYTRVSVQVSPALPATVVTYIARGSETLVRGERTS